MPLDQCQWHAARNCSLRVTSNDSQHIAAWLTCASRWPVLVTDRHLRTVSCHPVLVARQLYDNFRPIYGHIKYRSSVERTIQSAVHNDGGWRDTVGAARIMINHGRLRPMLEPRGDRRYLAWSAAQEWWQCWENITCDTAQVQRCYSSPPPSRSTDSPHSLTESECTAASDLCRVN